MKEYHYSDGKAVVLTVAAEKIVPADNVARANGFNPLALICGIGWNIIAYDVSKTITLKDGSSLTHRCILDKQAVNSLLFVDTPPKAARDMVKRYMNTPGVELLVEHRVIGGTRRTLKVFVEGGKVFFE